MHAPTVLNSFYRVTYLILSRIEVIPILHELYNLPGIKLKFDGIKIGNQVLS